VKEEEEKMLGRNPNMFLLFVGASCVGIKIQLASFHAALILFCLFCFFRREYIKYLEGKMQRAGDRPGHIHQVKSFF
jgi:hypothetical protein